MSFALLVNLVLGIVLATMGVLAIQDHSSVRWLTRGVLRALQGHYGEDFNIHPAVVGGLALAAGLFTLFVAFTIFAKTHDFWVVF